MFNADDGRTRITKKDSTSDAECVYCSDGRSLEELVALTEPSVQLLHGMLPVTAEDELQFALHQFIVHHGHQNGSFCPLEEAAIEEGQEVFVCGLLRAVVEDGEGSEDKDKENGVPVKMIGTPQ